MPPHRPMPTLVACCCRPPCPPLPSPTRPRPPRPLALAGFALALTPLSALDCVPLASHPSPPPSTATAISAIDDHHRRRVRVRIRVRVRVRVRAYQGAQTLCMHPIWMWGAVNGSLQHQP